MITGQQIRRIKTLARLIGLDDDTYREILYMNFGVCSCTRLSFENANHMINWLAKQAENMGVNKNSNKTKFNELANRPNMATPRQLRKVEAMWKDVCQQTSIEEMKRGLRKFLEKKCNVSDLKFLDKTQVTKLIVILNDMQKRKLKGAKREKH